MGTLLLLALLAFFVACGVSSLRSFPHERCGARRCDGGKVWNRRRTTFHFCSRCQGSGHRVRMAARIYRKMSSRK